MNDLEMIIIMLVLIIMLNSVLMTRIAWQSGRLSVSLWATMGIYIISYIISSVVFELMGFGIVWANLLGGIIGFMSTRAYYHSKAELKT